ncbi:hypothetical protein SAMN04488550_4565 [Gordonia malaquae]|uniref:Uncharacterized protein n=1 Tax=Gordonia malaquae NBRC 108250 TaxID=1223542 RepID=M3THB3_GORML|nr:hypothetical protein [Gordonia malaquae]GAC80856.1 hypothetical protein GM1_023_00150 [Gordonia malaquae NBRC 108250]SEB66580.1 hypothetical protein SAMN04488550_0581 [Gordonia malaquae]SEE57200.1 hypothetical protein SAMN04488550_4565 [Gordonia malaquae]
MTAPAATAVTRLQGLVEARRALDARIAEEVQAARDEGASWTAIGPAMGVTRQAALSKYGKLVGAQQAGASWDVR